MPNTPLQLNGSSLDRRDRTVKPGLTISVVDPDDDYLGIELYAASERYASATRIYAGLDELSALASQIEGFPESPADERIYEFGSTEPGVAGGFGSLRFCCPNRSGHAVLEVALEDDDQRYANASAKFSFRIHAADVDRFATRLRAIEEARSGEAVLQYTA